MDGGGEEVKLKKIISLCKKTNRVIIFQEWKTGEEMRMLNRQFISDGRAVYRVDGLPPLNKEAVLRIFDVEETKWDDWHCSVVEELQNSGLNLEDHDPTEMENDTFFCPMIINGKTLRIFGLPDGTAICVDEDLFSPLDDTDYRHYFVRRTAGGSTYLAVKNGMELGAIILPYEGVTDARADEMKDLAYRMRETVNQMRFKKPITILTDTTGGRGTGK